MKHTPGPWRVFTATEGHKIIGIGELNGAGIADCGFGIWRGGDEEALANARLIAASPRLLSALKPFARKDPHGMLSPEELDVSREDIIEAIAAVKEAEGREP